MSLHSERHHDATLAADQSDERMSVEGWHQMVLRCVDAAHRVTDYPLSHTMYYALVDAALHEALPERYPRTEP